VSRKECSLARKWVDHHLRNGVEHFTFYLNDNEDYWWNCLSNLERRGIVSLVNFTFPHHRQFYEQQAAMNSCGRRSRYTTRYLVQCDIDEFMVSFDPNYTLLDYVHFYEERNPKVSAFLPVFQRKFQLKDMTNGLSYELTSRVLSEVNKMCIRFKLQ
jgi:hypothetical protein